MEQGLGLPGRWKYDYIAKPSLASPDKIVTTEEKIKILEKTLAEKHPAKEAASTYQQSFGASAPVELFLSKTYNKRDAKDLKPIDRRPKKEIRPDYGK